ncbi:hypothetical protein C8R47DRAFT_175172 [Mycena vitilis]|nr:hypothetical protein C8R47DRAFT_175172 [Mycena vitilis]
MSYYAGQQGQSGQYADEYASHSVPSTSPDPNYPPQWEQQQETQHSQASEQNLSQQGLEQAEQHQPLSLPPPPPQQPLQQQQQQQLEHPQYIVPSQMPPRGTHDPTPIRLLPPNQASVRSPPVEIQPVMLQTGPVVRPTAHAGPSTRPAARTHPHQYQPYARPSSASGSTAAHPHVRFASQTHTPQAYAGSAMHSPGSARQAFPSPMRCAACSVVLRVVSPAAQ